MNKQQRPTQRTASYGSQRPPQRNSQQRTNRQSSQYGKQYSAPQKVDWGNETGRAFGIVGKIFLKLLSYVANILLTLLLVGLITGTVVGCTLLYYINNYIDADISAFDYVTTTKSTVSSIYYMDWTDRESRIGEMVELPDQEIYGSEYQMSVAYKDIPSYLWQAFVAVEDKRFFEHNGVDFITTSKSIFNLVFGSGTGGGSTITQQLVKNITGDNDRTIQRKVQEWLRAFKVEEKYDKTEILEMYLNNVPLSRGCIGVQAGAYTYFGKDVSELTLVECVAIASITQKPSAYDPISHPENNLERRNVVLDLMLEQGWISQAEHDSAYNQELVINYKGENNPDSSSSASTGIRSWYTEAAYDEAKQLLIDTLGIPEATASQLIYTQGYKIVTAMDPEIQEILEDYYENESNFIHVNDSAIQPECSAVIIDHSTGDVVALVGGRGEKTANNILNYATETQRSPGSSIKPLAVYAPAIDEGLITYGTVIDDTPVSFGEEVYDDDGNFVGYSDSDGYPDNYSKKYRGLTTVNYALTNSLNTISVKVLNLLTVEKSFNFVKNKLHIDSFIERYERVDGTVLSDKDISALALGGMNYGVTVLEMTAAYQIFPNNGVYNKPRIVLQILDSDGNVIISNDASSEVVISEQTASIMTKLLTNVCTVGTAWRGITCDNTIEVAGKTGTTTLDNDRWFVGYTPYYVCGVWFGYSYPQSLSAFSESTSPAVKVFDDVMNQINDKIIAECNETGEDVKTSFVVADGVVRATYCMDSGKLITDACKCDPRGSRAEVGYFTTDTVPTELCDCHVLVDIDSVNGGIANDDCPAENRTKVGLIQVTNRSFPCDIAIADAQYVYYGKLPLGISPGTTLTEPYFINMIPEGTYVGYTNSKEYTQYNHACLYIYQEVPLDEPTDEPTDDPYEEE